MKETIGITLIFMYIIIMLVAIGTSYEKEKPKTTQIKTTQETTTEKITYKLIIEENKLNRIEIE